ncbi:MAG: helix-turn-helix transcriptional regulator [Microbacteriaceae bacterium]|nr:helix-turn-helix transcriptional regulator [Microbacteriaceae bacterium]
MAVGHDGFPLHRYVLAVLEAKIAVVRGDVPHALEALETAEALGNEASVIVEQRNLMRRWSMTGDEAAGRRVVELADRMPDMPIPQRIAAQVLRGRASDVVHAAKLLVMIEGDGFALDGIDSPRITEREREVAVLIAEGLTNKQIAERLFLSVRTVESHVFSARAKLGGLTRRELGARLREGAA